MEKRDALPLRSQAWCFIDKPEAGITAALQGAVESHTIEGCPQLRRTVCEPANGVSDVGGECVVVLDVVR